MQRPKITSTNNQYGLSLVELILTIVIISVALVGILSVINLTTRHNAAPIVQQQAIAIAESYLEEILLLPVTDPDGSNAGESRASFDNISDYNGLINNGVIDQNGNVVTDLANYNVNVEVTNQTISGSTLTQVTVNVSRVNTTISLSGYRADY